VGRGQSSGYRSGLVFGCLAVYVDMKSKAVCVHVCVCGAVHSSTSAVRGRLVQRVVYPLSGAAGLYSGHVHVSQSTH